MGKVLDFNKLKKRYLTVTLADKERTTIMIGTPTKKTVDELLALKYNLEELKDDYGNEESTDELYKACAKIMSNNKGGIEISKEKLEDTFDFEDIMVFFNAYMEFVKEITNAKN